MNKVRAWHIVLFFAIFNCNMWDLIEFFYEIRVSDWIYFSLSYLDILVLGVYQFFRYTKGKSIFKCLCSWIALVILSYCIFILELVILGWFVYF